MFTEEDRGRNKVEYDLLNTIDKGIKRIRNLKLKDIFEGEE